MLKLKMQNGKYRSVTGSAAYGLAAAVIISLIMTGIVATGLSKEMIPFDGIGLACAVTWLVCSFIGCIVAMKFSSKKYLLTGALVAGGFLTILLGANIMFIGSAFSDIWKALLSIAAGYGIACAICIRTAGRGRKRKYHTR